MGLTTTELGDQCKNRSRVFSFTGQSAKNHTNMFIKGPREAGSREEELGLTVVFRSSASHHLLKSNRKFIRVERPTLSNFLSRHRYLIPWFHRISLRFSFMRLLRQTTPDFCTNMIGQPKGPLGITSEDLRVFPRSEEHTSELQSRLHLVCRPLL